MLIVAQRAYLVEIVGMKIMRENFRVNSDGWSVKYITWIIKSVPQKIKVKYHLNEEGKEDIWEYLEWEFVWEQLFTRDAGMRESYRGERDICVV